MEKIVIKISGELFDTTNNLKSNNLKNVIEQIKNLSQKYKIALVVGAGNIFRGTQNSHNFGIKQETGDYAGMLATIINGLVLHEMLKNTGVKTKLLSALSCPEIADNITTENISCAFDNNKIIIFVGGTGNPFFTTDTNAILRALQIDAKLVLKGTKVAGIFDKDPAKNTDAKLIKTIDYKTVIEKNLQVMDLTAISLAHDKDIKIKIFNIFEKDSILQVLNDQNFGSTIS
ncbi:MAG: Uridylate kinase [candidate division TM6 bacterium GW2011_GWF2_28_16]|nr:MAG: Uridylate kinase [candidate division TM6 bacterium GW2011_GWF2_28_16]